MENLSKRNQCLIKAYEMGYRVIDGVLLNPKGKEIGSNQNKDGTLYQTFNVWFNESYYSVPTHRLVGYQKYKERIFEKGLILRHVDNNSLNNKDENIVLGTHRQNSMDIPAEQRSKRMFKNAIRLRSLTDEQAAEMRSLYKTMPNSELMKKFGLTNTSTFNKYIRNGHKTDRGLIHNLNN